MTLQLRTGHIIKSTHIPLAKASQLAKPRVKWMKIYSPLILVGCVQSHMAKDMDIYFNYRQGIKNWE